MFSNTSNENETNMESENTSEHDSASNASIPDAPEVIQEDQPDTCVIAINPENSNDSNEPTTQRKTVPKVKIRRSGGRHRIKKRRATRYKPRKLKQVEPSKDLENLSQSSLNMLESASCVCFVCHQKLPNVFELESHMLEHSLYLCPSCERCFKYKRSYQNHRFICEDGSTKQTRYYPPGVKRPRKSQEMIEAGPVRRGPRKLRNPTYGEKLFMMRSNTSRVGYDHKMASESGISFGMFMNRLEAPSNEDDHILPSKPTKENTDSDLKTPTSVSPHNKATNDLVKTDSPKKVSNNSSGNNNAFNFNSQFMLPSAFMLPNGNPKEPLFLWQGIEIQSETNLVSRLEGYNPVTEQHYVLYKCCLCSCILPGMAQFITHLATTHGKAGSKEHSCDKCGAIFKWRSQLEVHEQVHVVMNNMAMANQSPLMVNRMLNVSGFDEPTKPGELQLFGQSAALPPNTLYPLLTNSINDQSDSLRPVSPSSQDGSANNQSRLNNYRCNFCPKTFDRLFSLQRHERIHTGIKICFCKHCGRGFSEKRNLRHHVIRFHSDLSQRDMLRRTIKPKARNLNPSHKLVSFLKKTAVRILNTMEQSKFNPTTDKPLSSEHAINSSTQNLSTDENSNQLASTELPKSNRSKAASNEGDYNGVHIVIPTEVTEGKKCSSETEKDESDAVQVLSDPKTSLMGSRRKSKPQRYTYSSKTSDDEAIDMTASGSNHDISPNEVKEEMDSGSEENNHYGLVHTSYSGSENSEDSFQDLATGQVTPQFKARLRGHGSFFSNYNPRLGVVSSPVARSQACRPQVGADGKFVYPCTYCYKTFCSTSDLNRHMDFHEDVRPFKCPFCSYFSRTNSQLKVHMMRHQGIKQFLCSLCNYNGVTQSDLNRHCKTRSHVMRERNSCNTCGIGFYAPDLLEEHMRLVDHSNDVPIHPMECVAASYGFIKREDEDDNEEEQDEIVAEVQVITDSDPEANNNDYEFGSKNKAASNLKKRKSVNS